MEYAPRACSRIVLNSLLVCLFTAAAPAIASNVWDGGGTDSYWSTPANWSDDTIVSNTMAQLVFSGDVRTTGTNDLVGLQAGGIQLGTTIRIEGERVVVSSAQVSEPTDVRYGWENNPACNLYNGADLPASPFRTDKEP